jgi:hypothetical protein
VWKVTTVEQSLRSSACSTGATALLKLKLDGPYAVRAC